MSFVLEMAASLKLVADSGGEVVFVGEAQRMAVAEQPPVEGKTARGHRGQRFGAEKKKRKRKKERKTEGKEESKKVRKEGRKEEKRTENKIEK